MRKALIFVIIMLIIGSGLALAWTEEEDVSFNIPVTQMLAAPAPDAPEVFVFPIEVRLLGTTPDHNWYKVKIAYDLPIFGHFEYVGWCYAPVGDTVLTAKK